MWEGEHIGAGQDPSPPSRLAARSLRRMNYASGMPSSRRARAPSGVDLGG